MPQVDTKRTTHPNRLAFTPFALKKLPIPKAFLNGKEKPRLAQLDYWDNSTPGFGLRVTSSGTKSWILMTRLLGQSTVKRFTIGRYAERDGAGGFTLAQARREALALKDRITMGEDPRQTEEEAKAEGLKRSAQTFRRVAEQFLEQHHPKKKKALRPTTLRRYTGLLLGPDFAPWFNRPLASITRRDVIALLTRMQGRGVGVSVNRALAVLRKLCHWAIQKDLIEHSPADHVEPPVAEEPRARHLYGSRLHNRPAELAMLWNACDEVGVFGALPKMLMLTGQRLSEVAGMRFDELVDLNGSYPRWVIPGTRTKNGKEHVIPLGSMAVQIIQSIPRLIECPFVFSTTGRTPISGFSMLKTRVDRHIATIKKQQPHRYADQFKLPWRFHDLRRTFKTGLAELGITADIRDSLVNHTPQGVGAHYDHGEYTAPKRAAMLRWEQHIMEQLKADGAVHA